MRFTGKNGAERKLNSDYESTIDTYEGWDLLVIQNNVENLWVKHIAGAV
jgi:hypothetical protein